ncbi:16S rRNA (uracil(1498)-N(3))-methyltransferase [Calidifontimicrobium sp. SYSU G02091]|uniref:16S rRNA (uracil(1498)-N(3))-methyltransferase n=1 Tax=Calidifontimicrobium sp. SYSU G02091 TaxID=2926421 RepID=UPI001F535258|nr:16S rRNA (uracil(1498)-N(3))-methyltransferase [Calidifontimicrobium sp. SYSU G02091]MCI1190318.1 16S rRNA (uracil(1498)-N(3))-methyltransferase [Calidifontimicrobium sp. SYSU G02091]
MPIPRVHVDVPLAAGARVELPPAAARHVQVLRLQPGDALTLFDGHGGEWDARIAGIGRQRVSVELGAHRPVERELHRAVTLALGMPANERMDALVEKAAELGAAAVQPLVAQRSVLRLAGERAERRCAHWQAVAVAACEQCGRNRVPAVAPVRGLGDWLRALPAVSPDEARLLLSVAPDAIALPSAATGARTLMLLSGPEGGLDPDEERAARERGFVPVTLGARVLRADTAPLAALAWLALQDLA